MKSSEIGIEMSTLKVLKYLLNDDNNAKTVMLSGTWGSGKTHFWLKEIRPQLKEKSQNNIYISLYGKESIGELKFEVLRKAYNLEVSEDCISKTASMISSIAPSLGEKSLVDGFDKLNKKAKDKKAEEILKSGSIICLDDFERKSTKIDLNDLFGYISQLALDYKCKIVIILNSDVFEDEEANVFKTVKEKTVNKFFYFEPSIEELFESIYTSDNKYKRLDEYRNEILSAIKETEELNARIYIQVLDNCLEWATHDFSEGLRALVLNTICFVKYNFMLSYFSIHKSREANTNQFNQHINYEEINYTTHNTTKMTHLYYLDNGQLIKEINIPNINIIQYLEHHAVSKKFEEERQRTYLKEIYDNKEKIRIIFQYGYELFVAREITKTKYEEITNFIKTGIFIKNNEDSSS